jgi:hypothetical protein
MRQVAFRGLRLSPINFHAIHAPHPSTIDGLDSGPTSVAALTQTDPNNDTYHLQGLYSVEKWKRLMTKHSFRREGRENSRGTFDVSFEIREWGLTRITNISGKIVQSSCEFKRKFNTDQYNRITLLEKRQMNGWNLKKNLAYLRHGTITLEPSFKLFEFSKNSPALIKYLISYYKMQLIQNRW